MINVAEQKTSRARAQTQSPLPETSPPSSTLLDGVSINFPAAKAESFFHLYLLHQVHSRSTSREHPAQSLADKRHSTNVSDPGSPPVPLNFLLPPPSSAHTLPSLIPLPSLFSKFITHRLQPPNPTTAPPPPSSRARGPLFWPSLASPWPRAGPGPHQDGRSAQPGPRAPCSSPPWCPGSRCPPRAGGCGSC